MTQDPNYTSLRSVLDEAYAQAATGKGKERHAGGQPFEDQPMQVISDMLGSNDGMAYQAIKKIREGLAMNDPDRTVRELLGAIVYVAGIVVRVRQRWWQASDQVRGEDMRDLSDEQIHYIASDGMRNAAGGIYERCVVDFAREVIAADRALNTQAAAEPVAWVDERAISWLADHHRRLDATIMTKLEARKSFERPMPLYADRALNAAQAVPLTILREMLADTREVFDANGSETPQVVRDVIEFVASWIDVYADKTGEPHGN